MAVKLRLKRMGAKKRPFYRIVAADSRNPRDGKVIEELGYYNPIVSPKELKIEKELVMKWLKNGAIVTDTVRDLFRKEGIMEEFHNVTKKVKKVTVKKETKAETQEVTKKTPAKKEAPKTAKKETTKKTTTKKVTTKKVK